MRCILYPNITFAQLCNPKNISIVSTISAKTIFKMCSVLEYLSLDDSSQEKWTFYYFILSWGAELGNGMIQTITGPMQPFLAYNLGTDTSTINLVWTLGFIGFLIGSILTSSIFTKHLHTGEFNMLLE